MPFIRRLVLPLLGALVVALTQVACPFIPERDNFVCGIRANDSITRCDGPDELCLCSAKEERNRNRCVTQVDEEECSSRFRYTFPEEEDGESPCVPDAGLTRLVSASSNALCDPAEETACGTPDPGGATIRCGYNQFCFCPKLRCAEPWPSCAADGGLPARLVATGECVGEHEGGLSAARERPDGICPGLLVDDLFPDAGSGDGGSSGTGP